MASLTEISSTTRKLVKYGSAALVFIIIGRVVLSLAVNLYNQLNPPPPPPPTTAFGKLPSISFPVSDYDGLFKYQVQTPTQKLPEFPDRAVVYFMPSTQPNLLALDRAKQKAALLGFAQAPEETPEEDIYQWIRNDAASTILKMNIISGSFKLAYAWENDPNILNQKSLPGEEQAKVEVQNYLQKAGLLETDLQLGKKQINYLKISGRKLVPAVSLSEANFVNVEMFRQNIEELPVLTPDPDKGIVSFILSGSQESLPNKISQYSLGTIKIWSGFYNQLEPVRQQNHYYKKSLLSLF